MTVAELIEKLSVLPPDLKIWMYSGDGGWNELNSEPKQVRLYHAGSPVVHEWPDYFSEAPNGKPAPEGNWLAVEL